MPMSLTVDGNKVHFYIIVHIIIYSTGSIGSFSAGRIRANHLRIVCIATLVGSPLLYIFLNARITASHVRRITRIFEHIITGSVNMHDRHLAVSFRLLTYVHTAHRSEGSNFIAKSFQAMITQPATHRETGKIDSVLVHMVLVYHFFDDSLHKLHIRSTVSVPHLVISQRISNNKTLLICHRIPLGLLLLILWVLVQTV